MSMTEYNARQTRWLSGLVAVTGLVFVVFVALLGPGAIEGIVAEALLLGAAAGLWWRWRPVRWLVAAGALLVGGDTVYELARALPEFFALESRPVQIYLALANALATTAVSAWLGARTVWILIDRAPGPTRWTRRLIGGLLVVVAAHHLSLLALFEPGVPVGLSFQMAPTGLALFGFMGWMVWHGVLAAVGLGLALASDRVAVHFATLLILLVVYALPASVVDAFEMWPVLALLAIPLYMAVWLRVELGRAARNAPIAAT